VSFAVPNLLARADAQERDDGPERELNVGGREERSYDYLKSRPFLAEIGRHPLRLNGALGEAGTKRGVPNGLCLTHRRHSACVRCLSVQRVPLAKRLRNLSFSAVFDIEETRHVPDVSALDFGIPAVPVGAQRQRRVDGTARWNDSMFVFGCFLSPSGKTLIQHRPDPV
jgi:hypothetical protein